MYIRLKNKELSYRYNELNLWRENDEKAGCTLKISKIPSETKWRRQNRKR